jgi:hypothetical protein
LEPGRLKPKEKDHHTRIYGQALFERSGSSTSSRFTWPLYALFNLCSSLVSKVSLIKVLNLSES